MKNLLVYPFIFFVFDSVSQDLLNYDWEPNPARYVATREDSLSDAIVIFEKHDLNYTYQGIELRCAEIFHVKKYISTDTGIENNNKIYFNTNKENLKTLKCRVISPTGKVTELSKNEIIESLDEHRDVEYRYFAVSGLEKGCILEYFYIFSNFSDYQNYIVINGIEKKKQVEIHVKCSNLFALDFYNKDIEYQKNDSISADLREYWASYRDIEKMVFEKFAPNHELKKITYYNLANPNYLKSQYEGFVVNYMTSLVYYNPAFFKKYGCNNPKSVCKECALITECDTTELQKTHVIEHYLKNCFTLEKEKKQGEDMYKTKRITLDESLSSMKWALRSNQIPFEVVYTCPINNHYFPTEFSSKFFIQDVFLYLPQSNVYFTPQLNHSIGAIPAEFVGNNGFFLSDTLDKKHPKRYDYRTKSKALPIPTMDYSTDELLINVNLMDISQIPILNLTRNISGYLNDPYQKRFNLLNEEEIEKRRLGFITDLLGTAIEVKSLELYNDTIRGYENLPITINATVLMPNLVTKVGESFIVSVGSLIGEQNNLYNEQPSERINSVKLPYLHQFNRTIVVDIPEGYKVTNTEALNIKITPDSMNNSIGFESKHELKGYQLTITIHEWYNQLTYPKEQYSYLVDTMNAAADFNSINILLVKL